MTPDELIARYQGRYDVAYAAWHACAGGTAEWLRLFDAQSAAYDALHAARLMLAVCRSQGL